MSDDKRADDGVRLRKFIDVVVEDKLSFTLFRGAVADISASGMRVISDQYLPKGTHYTFTMKRAPFLVARAEVRWIRSLERDTFGRRRPLPKTRGRFPSRRPRSTRRSDR